MELADFRGKTTQGQEATGAAQPQEAAAEDRLKYLSQM